MDDDISRVIEPMDFHPCNTPRGMLYYDMNILTDEQQIKLNALKIETAREDQKYLAAHPEIRACVALLTRQVLKQRPRANLHETIAEYFAKSRVDIESDIKEYLAQRGPIQSEATSALNLCPPKESESISYYSTSVEEEETREESFVDKLFDVNEMLMEDHVAWRDESAAHSSSTLGFSEGSEEGEGPESPLKGVPISDETLHKIAAPATKPSVTIKESLEEFTLSKSDDDARTYTLGHIPTIEDYDAGYGKRRQTFMSDSKDKQEVLSEEFKQYLKESAGEVSEKVDQHFEDVALEPARQSVLSEELLATLNASKVRAPTLSELKALKSQNVEAHESMKALMEKRSVRISVVASEQLKNIEDEFQKKHVQTVVKKGAKETGDDVSEEGKSKRVGVPEEEKSGDAHAIFVGATSMVQSAPNVLFVPDENGEEENDPNVESGNAGQDNNAAKYETVAEVVNEGETTTEKEKQVAEEVTEENQTADNTTEEIHTDGNTTTEEN